VISDSYTTDADPFITDLIVIKKKIV